MDQFNLRQKDVYSFDAFMDLKKPGFGGPNSAIAYDAKKTPKQLARWQHVVSRDKNFENGFFNPNYNSIWSAMEKDRASRDINKKQQTTSEYNDDLGTGGRPFPSLDKFVAVKEGVDGFVSDRHPAEEDDLSIDGGRERESDFPATHETEPHNFEGGPTEDKEQIAIGLIDFLGGEKLPETIDDSVITYFNNIELPKEQYEEVWSKAKEVEARESGDNRKDEPKVEEAADDQDYHAAPFPINLGESLNFEAFKKKIKAA